MGIDSNVAATAKIEEAESWDKNNGFHNIKNPENQIVNNFHLEIKTFPLETWWEFPRPNAFLSHHHFLQWPTLLCHDDQLQE